jgi:hypothetical protein
MLGLDQWKGVFRPVYGVTVESIGITQPETYYYTAYRIDWAAYQARIAERGARDD